MGYKVYYSRLWDIGDKYPNASSTIPGVILLNEVWASMLILHKDDQTVMDAFLMTMGHEVTHQKKNYSYLNPFSKNEKFVYWVNEVYADFGGASLCLDSDVDRAVHSLEWKKKLRGDRDKDHYMHPSWKKRIGFIQNRTFDKKLICEIASLTKCGDQSLVNRISDYFGEISI